MVFSFRHRILTNFFDHVTLAHVSNALHSDIGMYSGILLSEKRISESSTQLSVSRVFGCQQQKYAIIEFVARGNYV